MHQVGTEWLVTACGSLGKQHVDKYQYFHKSRYEQARELYVEWLAKYPYAEVDLREIPKFSYK